jgi:hypothetical protein
MPQGLHDVVNETCGTANRRFNFNKRSQPFIRSHNETLTVAVMRVCDKDRSPVGIHDCDAAQLQLASLSLSAIISQYFTQHSLP